MIVTTEHTRWEFEKEIKKSGTFGEVWVKDSKFAKQVTWILATNGIIFQKINYGCGVLRFLPNGMNRKVCTHCLGKGSVAK